MTAFSEVPLDAPVNVVERAQEIPTATPTVVPGFEWARATHLRDAVKPMLARYKLAAEFPDAIFEPSGIAELDEVVPIAPGRVIVVGGRAGAGKSALALQIARFISGRGPVLYLLTEMSLEEVITRTVASTAHVDLWKLERGARVETLEAAREALGWLAENADLTTVEAPSVPVSQILDGIRAWHAANPDARLIVMDNLWGLTQKMNLGDASTQSRRLGQLTNAICDLSVKLQVPIVLVHHLNKEGAPGSKAIPDASMLGGSDQIGNWASTVLVLRKRKSVLGLDDPFGQSSHELFIVKNRGGRTDMKLNLEFTGSQMRFQGTEAAKPFEVAPPETERDREYRRALEELPEW